MHLTNYSLNKHNADYVPASSTGSGDTQLIHPNGTPVKAFSASGEAEEYDGAGATECESGHVAGDPGASKRSVSDVLDQLEESGEASATASHSHCMCPSYNGAVGGTHETDKLPISSKQSSCCFSPSLLPLGTVRRMRTKLSSCGRTLSR